MARASEKRIHQLGTEIFKRMKGETPSVFRKDWWSGKMMDWSMKDEAFKVEMFRFVDVFPTLKDHVQVAEHLQEYFCRPEQDFPSSFQWGLSKVKPDSRVAKMAASQIEGQIVGMASRFIAGQTADEALDTLRTMWNGDLAFTVDLLGEATVSEEEARTYQEAYAGILDTLLTEAARWEARPNIEQAPWGAVPRVNISVKLSSLYSQMDPLDFDGTVDILKDRIRPLYRTARDRGAFINLDVEQSRYKDLTYAVFMSLLSEEEFQNFEHAGIVCQAYLRDSYDDLKTLTKWAKRRKTPVTVRLVKGAYWDYETIHSEQEGWPIPVYTQKWETDQNFEACTELLLDQHKRVRTAIASHNVRSIAHAMAYAEARRLDKTALEFQMLYGMAEPMKAAVQQMGYRLRDYVPIGDMIPGMAYLVRRLLENTSNESWLRMSFVEGESVDRLLAAPQAPAGRSESSPEPRIQSITEHGFRNEPLRDFSEADQRKAMTDAIESVRRELGKTYPLVINGREIESEDTLQSVNPGRPSQLVGAVSSATVDHARAALEAALQARNTWAHTPATERAACLTRVAQLMRARRDELAAWMIFEVAKTRREADADVCEAIDFCEYYAREMLRLDDPQRLGHLPGELNQLVYKPRGVTAVIAPWNFPLAILTGMAMAAAVTGNTVIMKPAEQSPVIAAKLMEICRKAGFPDGVLHFLPGPGESVGQFLVESPDIHVVAFTGSMEVGLKILKTAGNTPTTQHFVKKVVCEMGGKNAIIVDADADLDEAVTGVVHSAFGFQGQKCSACSRVIVHDSCYEEFTHRLVEATRSIAVGPADHPATKVGPVIDAEARDKILSYVALGREEGTLLLHRDAPTDGFYVGPTIFADISIDDRLAQEEIFGPVLAIMRASSFDDALVKANATRFALTGAVYSRSPLNIEKARTHFDVGNLYINRGSTGALVLRNPFGGYRLSGTGTKAGGPDYLQHFMEPRVVVENTMRRGFAPED